MTSVRASFAMLTAEMTAGGGLVLPVAPGATKPIRQTARDHTSFSSTSSTVLSFISSYSEPAGRFFQQNEIFSGDEHQKPFSDDEEASLTFQPALRFLQFLLQHL